MAEPSAPLVAFRSVSKTFSRPEGLPLVALSDVTLAVARGEWLAVLGKSGCGKTTLLNLAAGLDRPTTGEVQVAGAMLRALSETALAGWRGRHVGVVFQFFQLLPTLTVLENVVIAMEFTGVITRAVRRKRALELLALTGIADQADKLPGALSGGQQQRAAIARAMANDPPLLLADEPTGNLDSRTAAAVIEVFAELTRGGTTLMVVTHDAELARQADRSVEMSDGMIVSKRRSTGGES